MTGAIGPIILAGMASELEQAVAAEVRALMGRQKISGRALAALMREPPATVNRWVNGTTPMGLDELSKVAEALDTDLLGLLAAARNQLAELYDPRRRRADRMDGYAKRIDLCAS